MCSQASTRRATCEKVYATDGYEQSVTNLSQVSLASDMVFKGLQPTINSFRITKYVGAENRQLSFPTLSGPTVVNLRSAIFQNILRTRRSLSTNSPLRTQLPTLMTCC